jgi:hypothetical protein
MLRGFWNSLPYAALILVALLVPNARAATKVHTVALGKTITVPWIIDEEHTRTQTLRIRPLLVDGRVKEYGVGTAHEITERLFAIRRGFRVNDSLPDESGAPRWQWQRGGWLLVDRVTGRVSPIALPDFDSFYSAVSWYRDYAAYCGVSDDGKKTYAIVAQLSRHKPILKKLLASDKPLEDFVPDSACPSPSWQRGPARVSFEISGQPTQVFSIRGHVVDIVNDEEDDETAPK